MTVPLPFMLWETKVSILILSHYGDIHAEAVAWGLKRLGVPTLLVRPSDVPAFGESAVVLDGDEIRLFCDGACLTDNNWSLVWNRRRGRFSPDVRRSLGETRYVEFESRQMLAGFYASLEALYPMTNSYSRQLMSENKVVQLAAAARLGIAIPKTVFGNDPAAIARQFSDAPPAFKSFRVPVWKGSDVVIDRPEGPHALAGMTTRLSADHLQHHESIKACPGIYQNYIEKAYELRVLWLDGAYVAARINSQNISGATEDWRTEADVLEYEPYRLSPAVESSLRRLMDSLGLDSGSIDLIVTPAGQTVFLEVNPSGQFLWMDQCNPEINTYAAMIAFLIRKAGVDHQAVDELRFEDFEGSPEYEKWCAELNIDRYTLHTENHYSDDRALYDYAKPRAVAA